MISGDGILSCSYPLYWPCLLNKTGCWPLPACISICWGHSSICLRKDPPGQGCSLIFFFFHMHQIARQPKVFQRSSTMVYEVMWLLIIGACCLATHPHMYLGYIYSTPKDTEFCIKPLLHYRPVQTAGRTAAGSQTYLVRYCLKTGLMYRKQAQSIVFLKGSNEGSAACRLPLVSQQHRHRLDFEHKRPSNNVHTSMGGRRNLCSMLAALWILHRLGLLPELRWLMESQVLN